MSYEPDHVYPVYQPMTLVKPGAFEKCDMVEIRVILTPLRWHEHYGNDGRERELRPTGTYLNSVVSYSRIDAGDSRAIFYLLRQLLRNLVREWLGMKDDIV